MKAGRRPGPVCLREVAAQRAAEMRTERAAARVAAERAAEQAAKAGRSDAEWNVREWLRANGLEERDLPFHVHEFLEVDIKFLRVPIVLEAVINLWEWERTADGFEEPGAMDEIRHALRRRTPKRPGKEPSLSEKKRDEDDGHALAYARSCLRLAMRSPEGIPPEMADEIGRHLQEMKRENRSFEEEALLLWAERTDRMSRDSDTLPDEAEALRVRLKGRRRRN